MTDLFLHQKYIGSYNMPYDSEIYNYGNFKEFYGFDYKTDPRAISLKESIGKVENIDQLLQLISKTDQLKPCGDIAPRCDLDANPSAFGAVDAKIYDTQSIIVRNSPSYYNLPAFSFS